MGIHVSTLARDSMAQSSNCSFPQALIKFSDMLVLQQEHVQPMLRLLTDILTEILFKRVKSRSADDFTLIAKEIEKEFLKCWRQQCKS